MEYVNQYRAPVEKELNKIEFLNKIEKQTGVPKFYALLGIAAVLVLLIVLNVGAALITNIVGFLYPAYASFKALETSKSDDDTLWLTYWVVFSSFNILEYFIDWILFWLPFYFLIKLGFLVYLMHPTYKGAIVIYQRFLRQFLIAHEKTIDKKVQEFADKAQQGVNDLAKENPVAAAAVNQAMNEISKQD